ncbi:putative polysaccharide biosynthesis protein [Schleiferilactobacillus perolens]|jgi:PST family polysaccharide transporter|uniref:putative polysaccharide biosynthesis protein n=1 Tax=Schleiferilactobacillus perolens TaxID=100468 RepID=UPI00235756FA|nr:polysaccharide biosynthesis protein [Schleiferilactobacillus perolens]MCI2172570.1 polysaccharide biosynthesis protein [Schleiferilactobacillus perolens]
MSKRTQRTVFGSAALLSIAALIAKVLSAFYRVPLQNLAGDLGFYVYQQVYPLYGIGMTFALNGLPVFISRLVAEKSAADRPGLIKQLRMILVAVSLLAFVGFQLTAGWIAQAMGDPGLTPMIQAVAWMYLFMPTLALGRGYYQGVLDMSPTAVSQVVEQILRVAVIIWAAWYYHSHPGMDYYQMGTFAMMGATAGAIGAAITLYRYRHRDPFWHTVKMATPDNSWSLLTRRLVLQGGSICLFAAALILFQLVDSFTVARSLQSIGTMPIEARALKGIYDRGQPLVQLGLVLSSAFGTTLVPNLTHALQTGNRLRIQRLATQVTHISLMFSVAATAGLIALLPWINQFLFGDREQLITLGLYLVAIVLVAMINTYNSILQSVGNYRAATYGLLIGLALKIVLTGPLIRIFGLAGGSISTLIGLGVVWWIIFEQLPPMIRVAVSTKLFGTRLLGITIPMMAFTYLLAVFAQGIIGTSRGDSIIVTFIGILAGVAIFLIAALRSKLLTTREWLVLPFGSAMLHVVQRFQRK